MAESAAAETKKQAAAVMKAVTPGGKKGGSSALAKARGREPAVALEPGGSELFHGLAATRQPEPEVRSDAEWGLGEVDGAAAGIEKFKFDVLSPDEEGKSCCALLPSLCVRCNALSARTSLSTGLSTGALRWCAECVDRSDCQPEEEHPEGL